MKVLVACEESQAVCAAFRERGHEAYSCDLKETSGDHPEWHFIGDCLEIINYGWDLIIAHPPCTYISTVATSLHSLKRTPLDKINERTYKRLEACKFFMDIATCNCDRIAIENPVGVMNSVYRSPDQIIEPYEYAISEDEVVTKRTCLWLKNLPLLVPLNNFERPDNKKLG